jgi:hypothetical protein
LAVAAAGALVAAITYRPLGLALIAFSLIAITASAATIKAYRLMRGSSLPVLFLSRFSAPTEQATDVALNHQAALADRFRQEDLHDLYELRNINAPMGSRNALELVKGPPGVAAAFGTLRATADTALFDGKVAVRWTTWPRYGEPLSPVFDAAGGDYHASPFEAATVQELRRDADVPLRKLVSETFDVEHADALVAILLTHASGTHVDAALGDLTKIDGEAVARARDLLDRSGGFAVDLPPAVQAQRKIARANIALGEGKHPRAIIDLLEKSPGAAANVVAFWEHLVFLNEIASESAGASTRELRFAQQLVRLDPANAAYHFYLGLGALGGRRGRARLHGPAASPAGLRVRSLDDAHPVRS